MELYDDLIPLLNKAYFYLKFRPRSEKEVRDYLYNKVRTTHWSRDAADTIIKKLKQDNYINDKDFVSWFVRSRTNMKPKGERVLRRELMIKGINEDLINDFFNNNPINEELLASKLLQKRWSRYKNLSSQKQYEKISRFLLSRGFSFDLIKKIIKKFMEQ